MIRHIVYLSLHHTPNLPQGTQRLSLLCLTCWKSVIKGSMDQRALVMLSQESWPKGYLLQLSTVRGLYSSLDCLVVLLTTKRNASSLQVMILHLQH